MSRRPVAVLLALLLAVVAMLAVLAMQARSSTSDRLVAFWTRVADCETGGNWRMHGSSYSGGVGFANTTWRDWARRLGLLDAYPTADRAPKLVQIVVAQYGLTQWNGYWGCNR